MGNWPQFGVNVRVQREPMKGCPKSPSHVSYINAKWRHDCCKGFESGR
jgi:hypothetical protein